MDDRTLLERAARAAGMKVHRGNMPHQGDMLFLDMGEFSPEWNPLADDGDALRLAVALGIDVCQFPGFEEVHAQTDEESQIEQWGIDRLAATRRAIVRAAARLPARL